MVRTSLGKNFPEGLKLGDNFNICYGIVPFVESSESSLVDFSGGGNKTIGKFEAAVGGEVFFAVQSPDLGGN